MSSPVSPRSPPSPPDPSWADMALRSFTSAPEVTAKPILKQRVVERRMPSLIRHRHHEQSESLSCRTSQAPHDSRRRAVVDGLSSDGGSNDESGDVSRTVRDMIFGATITTAGLWVLTATIMLLRK
jgi:hypothetical protein